MLKGVATLLRRCVQLVLVLFIGCCMKAYAQPSELASVMVLRAQAMSIAEEIIRKSKSVFPDSSFIELKVEGSLNQTMTENTFADVLGKLGYRITLGKKDGQGGSVLQILILEQGIRYSGKTIGGFERKARTLLEARYQRLSDSALQYIGLFTKETVDTVSQREEVTVPVLNPEAVKDNTASFFDRIAGPALVISGAFLIVYLFFTVRN